MLKLENVTKIFNPGTPNEKLALDKLNFEVEKGEFVTIIGGNGAGKSTLMNIVSGVYDIDGGKIFIDGQNVSAIKEHRRAKYLGRVFQDPMMGTAGDMNIEENLSLAMRRGKSRTLRWGMPKKERAFLVEKLASLELGLETRITSKVRLLSGGQRQAITLLMATLQQPKLLLLDEHTAALDPKTAQKVLKITEEITSESSLTTLMITHNMSDAIRYGNRLVMMHAGRIIFDIKGEEKQKLTVKDLLQKFEQAVGNEFANDRMLLN